MSNEASPRERHPCPKCGREAEWLEEHPDEIEYGCEKNHRWFVDK